MVALSPADHDRLVAVVSHVPHLVAATLMNAAAEGAEEDAALLRLAAGGFRDMTRVAAGQPGIWPDICADNAGGHRGRPRPPDGRPAEHAGPGGRWRTGPGCWTSSSGPAPPAVACRRGPPGPNDWPSCGCRCPTAKGSWPRSPRLAGDLGINIYDIEIAHSAEGPRGVLVLVVDGAGWHTAARRGDRPGLPLHRAGLGMTRSGRPSVDPAASSRWAAPLHRHRPDSGRQVDLAPGLLLGALAEGTHVVRGLSDGEDVARTAAAMAAVRRRRSTRDGATVGDRRRTSSTRPSRPGRLRELGHRHAAAGRIGWPGSRRRRPLVGDDSLSARPMDRIAEPLRAMGATVEGRGRALPAAAARGRRRPAGDRLDHRRWPAPR